MKNNGFIFLIRFLAVTNQLWRDHNGDRKIARPFSWFAKSQQRKVIRFPVFWKFSEDNKQ